MFLLLAACGKRFGHLTASLSDDIKISPSMDEVSEIEEGLEDIEEALKREKNPRSGPYWPKIRETLLQNSSSQDIDEAIKEWDRDGLPYISREVCQLCGKNPIKFCFPIKNRVAGNRLIVGCECIHNYLVISGYEAPEALKKLLTSQLNLLKKKEKGEASEEELVAGTKVYDVEHQIRRRLGLITKGAKDFDLREYAESVNSIVVVGNHLSLKDPAISAAESVLKFIKPVQSFMEKTRKAQKFDGYGLSALTTVVMAKRKPEVKLAALETLLSGISRLFDAGLPNDVISRGWDSIAQGKVQLIEKVAKKCDQGKAMVLSDYRYELDATTQYEHLNFMIDQGLEGVRKTFDDQLRQVRETVEDPEFIDKIQRQSGAVAKILSLSFYPNLASSDSVVERNAWKTIEFVRAINRGRNVIDLVSASLEKTYNVGGSIKDLAGIKVALLTAGDDGVLDVDIMGDDAITDFAKRVEAKDPKVLEIVQKKVKDLAELVKRTGNQRVFEAMSEQLEFDVERVYKLYSALNEFENSFCSDILTQWESGHLNSLSPGRMSNIKTQLVRKARIKEVQDSMWEKLHSRLMAKLKSTFR